MPDLADQLAAFEREPPPELVGDPIWRLPAYRIGAFLAEVAEADCVVLRQYPQYMERAAQLQEAIDSIPANITEGYGRTSGKDRARFYEVALSSAREARDWYRRVRHVVGHEEALGRAMLLTRIVRILVRAIPEERAGSSEARIRAATSRPRRKEPSRPDRAQPDCVDE